MLGKGLRVPWIGASARSEAGRSGEGMPLDRSARRMIGGRKDRGTKFLQVALSGAVAAFVACGYGSAARAGDDDVQNKTFGDKVMDAIGLHNPFDTQYEINYGERSPPVGAPPAAPADRAPKAGPELAGRSGNHGARESQFQRQADPSRLRLGDSRGARFDAGRTRRRRSGISSRHVRSELALAARRTQERSFESRLAPERRLRNDHRRNAAGQ